MQISQMVISLAVIALTVTQKVPLRLHGVSDGEIIAGGNLGTTIRAVR